MASRPLRLPRIASQSREGFDLGAHPSRVPHSIGLVEKFNVYENGTHPKGSYSLDVSKSTMRLLTCLRIKSFQLFQERSSLRKFKGRSVWSISVSPGLRYFF